MEKFDAACLTDAKKEYTQRLVRKIKTPFSEKIFSILKEVKDECSENHEDENILFYFQNKLQKVPEWEDVKISQFTNFVIAQTKCDYIEELLQAVFIVHTKVLAVIQPSSSNKKSEIKLPSIEDFIFQAFINTAKEMWKFAYIFKKTNNSCEYQQNATLCEDKIAKVIVETIEDMLPVRDLLVEHVKEYIDDDDDDDNNKNKLYKKKKGGSLFPSNINLENVHPTDEIKPISLDSIKTISTDQPIPLNDSIQNDQTLVPIVEEIKSPTTSDTPVLFAPSAQDTPVSNPVSLTGESSTPAPVSEPVSVSVPSPVPAQVPEPIPSPVVTQEIKTVNIPNGSMLDSVVSDTVNLSQPKTVTFETPPAANLKGGASMVDMESLSLSQI